ncbi:MAG: apolipoprotein N-acyltransferase [Acidimicrobiales bacterium]
MTSAPSTAETTEPVAPPTTSRWTVPVWLRCVVAGLAVVASMPPWGWWPLAIVGIAMLDQLIADQPAAARFRRTWLMAAVWLSIGMFWMWDMTPPGYLVAFSTYAAYFGLAAVATPPGAGRRIALPGAVGLAEAIRWAFPFGGVPLATIPQGQVAGPLAEVVRVAGPVLLVMVTVIAGQALASAVRRRPRSAGIGTAVVVATVLVATIAPTSTVAGTLDVAVVQGGGEQRTRDSAATRPIVFQAHLDASDLIEGPVDLVLWPENVVHVGDDYDTSERPPQLADLAREVDATLVAGIVETAGESSFHNAAVVFDPDGSLIDRYDKVRRVPFGEMTPFRGVLERIAGDTIVANDAIPGDEPALIDTPVGPMSVAISWEVFFAGRVREGVRRDAEVVLNPTNGASYWLTIVQSQQIASSRLRALETDRWVLQAAPTGFSAVIEPDGTIIERSGVGEQRVIEATVERRTGSTLAVRLGDRPPIAAAGMIVLAAWLLATGRLDRFRPRSRA